MEIKNFSISGMPKLVFGHGSIRELPSITGQYGQRILLVTGGSSLKESGMLDNITASLSQSKSAVQMVSVSQEPTPDIVDRAIKDMQGKAPHVVVAIGGGSVLDTGKAISAMLAEEGSVWDYLEGVGKKKPSGVKAPFIAVPTTSGTGSEATKNAVLSMVGPGGFKKSLRHDNYIPDVAIIDPMLTLTCSPAVTASCGMDALSQLIESYTSAKANPFTDALALSGIEMFSKGFLRAYQNGHDSEARAQASYASFISGLTLSQAGLGSVHGIAGSIGGLFPVPHGTACGTLLGEVMKEIVCEMQKEQNPGLAKIAAVGRILDGSSDREDAFYCERCICIINDFIHICGIPRLGIFGINGENVQAIVDGSDNKNSPVLLDKETMAKIIQNRL
jgi:alcohol dehydrogenase class IV